MYLLPFMNRADSKNSHIIQYPFAIFAWVRTNSYDADHKNKKCLIFTTQ